MRSIIPRSCMTAIIAAALVAASGPLAAQAPDSARSPKTFGMDEATFNRHFGARPKQVPPRPVEITGVEGLAAQVTELKIFLTNERDMVTGEIVFAGTTKLKEVTIPLEAGPVKFTRSRDNAFTARFRMDTTAAWKTMRAELGRMEGALRAPDKTFVSLGPRNLVPLKDAQATLGSAFRVAAAPPRALLEGGDPVEAAKRANIDIARVPFVWLPGPRLDLKPAERFRRFLDIPVFDFFPPLPPGPPPPPVAIDENRSLMITDIGVVENPGRTFDVCGGPGGAASGTAGGPWSFGHLMREMSFGTGLSPEDFVLNWLSSWSIPQEANGFIVSEPGRGSVMQSTVVAGWQVASGGAGAALDVDKFPARLLAIVNRPDLADKIGYGVAGSAGEGRFVFGLLNKTAGSCNPLPFTVIFEYGVKGGSCTAVKTWHQKWKDLDADPIGSAAYNTKLEAITRAFTDHGSNASQSPNQNSLNQLRTNENALNPLWQLREFKLQSTGMLDLVTVKQTPDDGLRNGTNGTAVIGQYLVNNEVDILADKDIVPERFPGVLDLFMGAKSEVPFPPSSVFWTAPNLATLGLAQHAETRRKFSLSTCNACHGGETGTFFTHIGNTGMRSPGSAATLSNFLLGTSAVTVPVTNGLHLYADLAEREAKMSDILNQSCFSLLGFRKLPFTH